MSTWASPTQSSRSVPDTAAQSRWWSSTSSSTTPRSIGECEATAGEFVGGRHPSLGRRYRDCGYKPMVELLRYLEANGFTAFIASGGDRDFMRPFAQDLYGIPPERVIGSSNALGYDADANEISYLAKPDVFDDGPAKPVRIWSRIGRRPTVAGGNSNGDIPMLQYAGGDHPALRLLVLHKRVGPHLGGRHDGLIAGLLQAHPRVQRISHFSRIANDH